MTGSSGEHPRDLLSAYLDGELSAAERATVASHLEGCHECREHLLSLRALASAVRGEALPAVPADLEARIGRRIDAATVVPFRRRFAVPATIAATIAAIGLVSVVLFEQHERPVPERAPAVSAPKPPLPPVENMPRLAGKDEALKKTGEKTDTDALRRDVKRKQVVPDLTPAPAPPPVAREESAAEPQAQGGGVPGGVVGGVAGRPHEAPAEKDSRERASSLDYVKAPSAAAKSVAAPSLAGNVECAEVADAPAEGTWLVRDTDEAERVITDLAVKLGGRRVPQDPHDPMTVVLEVPAARYPAFVAEARKADVLGLDDAGNVAAAGCVRQRIVLRRVAVN